MKKILFSILTILIAGSLGGGYFLYQKDAQTLRAYPPVYAEGEKAVVTYLPDSAAAVGFIKGLGEAWPQFLQSALFRQLKETQTIPLFSSLVPPRGDVGLVDKGKFLFAEEFFLGAFGQEMALAFYPPKIKGKNSFLLVSKTGYLFKIEETLFTWYHKYLGSGDLVSHRIGNFLVTVLPADFFGVSLYYAVVDNAILLSNSLDLLKESLGIAGGGEIPRLVDSQDYIKSAGAPLSTTRYGVFLAYKRIQRLLGKEEPSGAQEIETPLLVSSFSRILIKDGLLIHTNYFSQKEKLDLLNQRLAASSSDTYKTVNVVPSDAVFFATSKGWDADFIAAIGKAIGQDNPVAQIFLFPLLDDVQKEDAVWKNEISVGMGAEWALTALQKSDDPAILQWAFLSEIKNAQKTSELIEKVLAEKKFSLDKRSYKDLNIHRISLQGDSQPEYLFYENLLIFGTGEEIINKIIDTLSTKEEPPSLKNGKIYTSSGMTPENHFLFLLDGRAFVSFAQANIKNLSGSLPEGFGKTESSLAAALDIFSIVSSVASETVVSHDHIKTKTVVGLKGVPLAQKKASPSPQPAIVPIPSPEKTEKVELPIPSAPVEQAAEEKGPDAMDKITPEPSPPSPVQTEVPPLPPVTTETTKQKETAVDEKGVERSPETVKPDLTALPSGLPALPEGAAKTPPPISEKIEEKTVPTGKDQERSQVEEKSREAKEPDQKSGEGEESSGTPEEKSAQETAPGETPEPQEEKFVYSAMYEGKPLRDPFASLIAIEIAQIAQTVDISNLWKELEKIGPINLYLYERAKKADPLLIKKIEDYTDYFKDTKKLENRSDKEVTEKVKAYSDVVAQLIIGFREKYISPLNFNIGSLSLVGIITGAKNNYALVQTPDSKGYTLRKGDIVGTNYGEVVSIEPSKVVIEEKYRNYIGKITTETVVFELKKEEGGL